MDHAQQFALRLEVANMNVEEANAEVQRQVVNVRVEAERVAEHVASNFGVNSRFSYGDHLNEALVNRCRQVDLLKQLLGVVESLVFPKSSGDGSFVLNLSDELAKERDKSNALLGRVVEDETPTEKNAARDEALGVDK